MSAVIPCARRWQDSRGSPDSGVQNPSCLPSHPGTPHGGLGLEPEEAQRASPQGGWPKGSAQTSDVTFPGAHHLLSPGDGQCGFASPASKLWFSALCVLLGNCFSCFPGSYSSCGWRRCGSAEQGGPQPAAPGDRLTPNPERAEAPAASKPEAMWPLGHGWPHSLPEPYWFPG